MSPVDTIIDQSFAQAMKDLKDAIQGAVETFARRAGTYSNLAGCDPGFTAVIDKLLAEAESRGPEFAANFRATVRETIELQAAEAVALTVARTTKENAALPHIAHHTSLW